MLTEELFATRMTMLCEMYDREPSKTLLDVYYLALKGLTDEQFNYAFSRVISNRKYANMPLPAEFLTIINGNNEDDALVAWHKVVDAVKSKCGSWQSPVFDDPMIHIAIARGFPGGWIGLCERLTEENQTWIQKDFVVAYEAYKGGLYAEYPPRLIGRSEGQNTMTGHVDEKTQPVLIGDPKKCLALLATIEESEALGSGMVNALMEGVNNGN